MPLETFHTIAKGISRLCCAPSDVEVSSSQGSARSWARATEAHRDIFQAYLANLGSTYESAAEWWTSLIDSQMEAGGSRQDAIDASFERRLAGPAAAPEVVTLVRETWLKCAALNATLDEPDRVPPEVVLLGWLVDGRHDDFVQLITAMPYWPIGLDEYGNWC